MMNYLAVESVSLVLSFFKNSLASLSPTRYWRALIASMSRIEQNNYNKNPTPYSKINYLHFLVLTMLMAFV